VALRIDLGSPVELEAALSREWLVTNGLGGYASGTISGINTRRYHGLLVAALEPPVRRMVLLAQLEEWILFSGAEPRALSAQEYWDGTIFPDGFTRLARVEIDGMLPRFLWSVDACTIERRIWMEHDANRTVVSYRLVEGGPITLRLRPLFAHRDYHEQRHGSGEFDIAETGEGWIVDASGIRSYLDVRSRPKVESGPDWYWRVLHRAERVRGLDAEEDLFTPGLVEIAIEPGAEATLVIGTEPLPATWSTAGSLQLAERRQDVLIDPTTTNPLAVQLAVAAEQFRVARCIPSLSLPTSGKEMSGDGLKAEAEPRSVIAGYHWFTDWGRDSMISLRGLAMRPGIFWEARGVLETNLRYLDQGLIPNRFPDRGEAPEYNTMDATLWMFQALAAYERASGDWRFIAERLDALESVIDWHVRGTRHNIRIDESDGLLAGGEEGFALTWMDARVQDLVVTPRRGKPIEINALWYNALRLTADWCERAGRPAGRYHEIVLQLFESAQARFWYAGGSYFYDCLDGPEGDDPSLRPNQVIAMALVYPLLDGARAKAALEVVTRKLLTPYGLRTLSPDDPRYRSTYRGDQQERDATYHMGMVWPWLLGPYLDARLRLDGDRRVLAALLEPFNAHLSEAGLGTISEIFEPEPPYRPVGCIAQAWSVAEVLRHAREASHRR
jgi:predicted glycogen debranching enzyme